MPDDPNRDLTVVVSIGRNVADAPAPAVVWLDFQESLAAVVDTYKSGPDGVLARWAGRGIWEGAEEDSAAILFLCALDLLPEFDAALVELAQTFHQDSIGRLVHDPATVLHPYDPTIGRSGLYTSYVVGPSYVPSAIDGPADCDHAGTVVDGPSAYRCTDCGQSIDGRTGEVR